VSTHPSVQIQLDLAGEVSQFYADPLGFVLFAYPWGEAGTKLVHHDGPDDNQREFLTSLGAEVRKRGFNGRDPVMPIRMSESSGHGTGKSAMAGWIADWILSTRRDSMGTVTAGTATQLKERTWAAIQSWTGMCITAPWFNIMAEGIYHKSRPKTWKVVTQTCKPENAQSFAGQHAIDSTSWFLFDEASAVPDEIWTPAEQGLTDGEPMFFAWGQMERNTGRFYDVCFGEDSRKTWNHRRVDSRTSRFTNKEYIKEILETRGEDSDYAKVRVFGFAPSASELQFIDKQRIEQATKMPIRVLPEEPLICGVDVSGGGEAWNVCYFRRGMDGRSKKRYRLPGEAIRHDRGVLVGKLADFLADQSTENRVAAMFIDSAFGSPIVERLRALGFGDRVHEINFGGDSPDPHQANMRAYMWFRMKEWLLTGAIPDDRDISEKYRLAYQLALPGYHPHRQTNKLVLESKQDLMARNEKSPDDADALALTFARPVAPPRPKARSSYPSSGGGPWS
jgi:hypothetical protein